MSYFRKKPVVIEAHRWDPNERPTLIPSWLWDRLSMAPEDFDQATGVITIRTLEGRMQAQPVVGSFEIPRRTDESAVGMAARLDLPRLDSSRLAQPCQEPRVYLSGGFFRLGGFK